MLGRLAVVALSALTALSLGKCKRSSAEGSAEAPSDPTSAASPGVAPTIQWTEHEATVSPFGAKIRSNVFDLDWSLSFEKLPKGTKVRVGDQSAVTDERGSTALKVPIADAIGGLAPKDALRFDYKFDPKLTLELELPDGTKVTTQVPGSAVNYGVQKAFEALKDKPVLFGKEPLEPQTKHSVVLATTLQPEVLGAAATLREVDWVALADKLPGRAGKMCTGYKGKDEKATMSLPLDMVDHEITIYERKTAKVIDSKKFIAPEKCPMFVMGDKATTYPDNEEIKKWLRERRDKK